MLFDAIKQAAVVEADGTLHLRRTALREALFNTRNYRGLTGVLTCDPNGDCAAREGLGIYQLTPAEVLQGHWPPPVFWSPRSGLDQPAGAALPGQLCLAVNGAIDDRSFNASAWQGAQEAARQFRAQAVFVEARSNNEIPAALEKLAASHECALVTAVGFPFGDALARAAPASPAQRFQIVDYAYEGGYDNVWAQAYAVDQAAFLAGYVAASVSQSGKVGTFGGMALPPVEDFMDGFALGVAHYNATHNANVAVLGWDVRTRKGYFTNDFNSPPAGANMAERLIKDGADVIFPVAGLTAQGAGEIALKHGNVYLIGTDTDWHVSSPQFGKILLTSVEKRVGASIFAAAQAVAGGDYKGGAHLGTLANGEVGLAPFYELDRLVSEQIKADLEQIRADIIAGRIKTKP
jgi:basic membrane protein A